MVMVRGWGWGLASALSVVVGARGADFAPFYLFWGPREAAFVHVCLYFAWFCLFFGLGGAVPRPLCGSGPPFGLIGGLFLLIFSLNHPWNL